MEADQPRTETNSDPQAKLKFSVNDEPQYAAERQPQRGEIM